MPSLTANDRKDQTTALAQLCAEMQRDEPEATLVFGEGSPEACLAIVGEAPGPEEERQGRPFVGRAGGFLDELLAEVGIERSRIWVTNVVKRRPISIVQGKEVTRAPARAEIQAHLPWLERELAIIRPRLILCLGMHAAEALIHRGFRLQTERGRWFQRPDGSQAMATYHPAYVRRFGRESHLTRRDFHALASALKDCQAS